MLFQQHNKIVIVFLLLCSLILTASEGEETLGKGDFYKAANFYESEFSKTNQEEYLLESAQIYFDLGEYLKAAQLYEKHGFFIKSDISLASLLKASSLYLKIGLNLKALNIYDNFLKKYRKKLLPENVGILLLETGKIYHYSEKNYTKADSFYKEAEGILKNINKELYAEILFRKAEIEFFKYLEFIAKSSEKVCTAELGKNIELNNRLDKFYGESAEFASPEIKIKALYKRAMIYSYFAVSACGKRDFFSEKGEEVLLKMLLLSEKDVVFNSAVNFLEKALAIAEKSKIKNNDTDMILKTLSFVKPEKYQYLNSDIIPSPEFSDIEGMKSLPLVKYEDTILSEEPENEEASLMLAVSYLSKNSFNPAQFILAKAFVWSNEELKQRAIKYLSYSYYLQREYKKVLETLDFINNSSDKELLILKGISYLALNDIDNAIIYLEKSVALFSDVELSVALSSAYKKNGNYKKSAALLEKILMDSSLKNEIKSICYYNLGVTYLDFPVSQNRYDMAVKYFNEYLKLVPLKELESVVSLYILYARIQKGIMLSTTNMVQETVSLEDKKNKEIQKKREMLISCYRKAKNYNPYLKGKILLEVFIGKEGEVLSASITEDSLKNEDVNNCVLQKIQKIKFERESIASPKIVFPVLFY